MKIAKKIRLVIGPQEEYSRTIAELDEGGLNHEQTRELALHLLEINANGFPLRAIEVFEVAEKL